MAMDQMYCDAVTEIEELKQKLAAERERQEALEAHVEQLKPALESFSMGHGVCCCGDNMNLHANPMDCGHMPVDSGWYAIEMYMRAAPETSLAQRDARVVSELADWADRFTSAGHVLVQQIRKRADEIAAGGSHDR